MIYAEIALSADGKKKACEWKRLWMKTLCLAAFYTPHFSDVMSLWFISQMGTVPYGLGSN